MSAIEERLEAARRHLHSLTRDTPQGVVQGQEAAGRAEFPEGAATRTRPHCRKEFGARVASFVPGGWDVDQLSVLACARRGWRLVERQVLQCVTCGQVVCGSLPPAHHPLTYEKFLRQLVERVLGGMGHRPGCGWRVQPSPPHLALPRLALPTTPQQYLYTLGSLAQDLVTQASQLPAFNCAALLEKLGVDEGLVEAVKPTVGSGLDGQGRVWRTAVLLVLTGWSLGPGPGLSGSSRGNRTLPSSVGHPSPVLTCEVCQRMVGLWSLQSLAEADQDDPTTKHLPALPASPGTKRKAAAVVETGQGLASPEKKSKQRKTETGERSIQVPVVGQGASVWNNRLRGRRSSQGQDDAAKAGGTQGATATQHQAAASQQQETCQAETRRCFSPLEDHRHWCSWVSPLPSAWTRQKEQGVESLQPQEKEAGQVEPATEDIAGQQCQEGWMDEDMYPENTEKERVPGFQLVVKGLQWALQASSPAQLPHTHLHASNVEGVRMIRRLLDGVMDAGLTCSS